MTLEIARKEGAIWQFDCQFGNEGKYTIKDTRRVQANRGVVNPPAVGGVTGNGTVSKNKLTLTYTWKRPNEPDNITRFNGDLVEEGK